MITILLLIYSGYKKGNIMNRDIYVVPFFGNWAVKQSGKEYPVSTHNLKLEAIRIARQLTKRLRSELIILDTNELKED